jgi:hypothetical protein
LTLTCAAVSRRCASVADVWEAEQNRKRAEARKVRGVQVNYWSTAVWLRENALWRVSTSTRDLCPFRPTQDCRMQVDPMQARRMAVVQRGGQRWNGRRQTGGTRRLIAQEGRKPSGRRDQIYASRGLCHPANRRDSIACSDWCMRRIASRLCNALIPCAGVHTPGQA